LLLVEAVVVVLPLMLLAQGAAVRVDLELPLVLLFPLGLQLL